MSEPAVSAQAHSRRWIEFGFLGLLAVLWGSSYLFISIAVAEVPPFTLIAIRVTLAAAFLLAIMHWRGEHLPRDGKTWQQLLVQSFLNAIGAWTILAWGQQHVDSALASVLNSTSPLFVFLFTVALTRHEPAGALKFAGAFLGFFGVVLIVGAEAIEGLGMQIAGQLAALTGAMLYAGAAIYGKKFAHLSATQTAAGTMIWASVWLVPLALIIDQPWRLAPSSQAMGAAAMLGLFCTGIALLIYFRLIKTLGSLGVASQAYLRAGVGVLLGIVFLGEEITWPVGLGLLAALVGVAAMNMRPGDQKQPSPVASRQ